MRKRILLIPLFVLSIFVASSCGSSKKDTNNQINDNPDSMYIKYDTEDYSVTEPTVHSDLEVIFDCNNGFKYKSYLTLDNRALKPTKDPVKKASTFVGWYSDEELKNEYDFNSTNNKNITIYAKYETDYEELSNIIYEETILSNIKIVATFSDNDTFTGNKTESVGSGIIFSASETGYYALTNNHVVYKDSTYIYEKYDIYDCYNNHYNGSIIYKDVDYDLAIIQFNRGSIKEKLNDISFSSYLPKENDTVISIGNPNKIMNSISYGKYLGTEKYDAPANIQMKSNIHFDVLRHNSKIETGSSGGMLLDNNLRLVGVNFASIVKDGKYEKSYAIPLAKVTEFILNFENN